MRRLQIKHVPSGNAVNLLPRRLVLRPREKDTPLISNRLSSRVSRPPTTIASPRPAMFMALWRSAAQLPRVTAKSL